MDLPITKECARKDTKRWVGISLQAPYASDNRPRNSTPIQRQRILNLFTYMKHKEQNEAFCHMFLRAFLLALWSWF